MADCMFCGKPPGIFILKITAFVTICSLFLLLLRPAFCPAGEYDKCVRVLDGDTIVLANGERVRLIGIDTTEKSHPLKPVEYFSEEATQFTKRLLEGKEVKLEFDKDRRDKYGRLLTYVYLSDGTFANAEIIKQGYGFAYTKYPFKYEELFVSLEEDARNNQQGYWKRGEKGELSWILQKQNDPFLVYQMSRGLWGVKYDGFVKTGIDDDDLVSVLSNLRTWIHEFHEDDLTERLLNSGWERWNEK